MSLMITYVPSSQRERANIDSTITYLIATIGEKGFISRMVWG